MKETIKNTSNNEAFLVTIRQCQADRVCQEAIVRADIAVLPQIITCTGYGDLTGENLVEGLAAIYVVLW